MRKLLEVKNALGMDYLNKNLLRLGEDGLQTFNDDPADPPADPDPSLDNPPNPDNKDDKGGDNKDQDPAKSFTQEDVNSIAAKEAKKATEKLLKQLGVKEFKDAKDGLSKYQEILDAQKTDADKLAEQAQALETSNQELTTKYQTLEAENAALKADVNPDSLNDVIVLARAQVSEDVTMEEAIGKVLEKYPNFKKEAAQQKEQKKDKPKFTEGEHKGGGKQTEADQWSSAFTFGIVNPGKK
jgi:hypothetical protein